jgi:hypothetical protein
MLYWSNSWSKLKQANKGAACIVTEGVCSDYLVVILV